MCGVDVINSMVNAQMMKGGREGEGWGLGMDYTDFSSLHVGARL